MARARPSWRERPQNVASLNRDTSEQVAPFRPYVPEQEIKVLGERLGETDRMVLQLIRSDSQTSTRTLALEIGVSTTTVDKTLSKLKKQGILRRIGPARGGHWEILEDDDG